MFPSLVVDQGAIFILLPFMFTVAGSYFGEGCLVPVEQGGGPSSFVVRSRGASSVLVLEAMVSGYVRGS